MKYVIISLLTVSTLVFAVFQYYLSTFVVDSSFSISTFSNAQPSEKINHFYKNLARYPPTCEPISSETDPVPTKYLAYPNSMRSIRRDGPVLSVWPSKVNYISPDTVMIYAKLSNGNRSDLSENLKGKIQNNEGKIISILHFRKKTPSSHSSGLQTSEIIYESKVKIYSHGALSKGGVYTALVNFKDSSSTSEEIATLTRFVVSSPLAKLTGRFREHLRKGDLTIEAEISVMRSGRYYLEGSLYSADGRKAIERCQNALWLHRGVHWFPLTFCGLILQESGISGSYNLKFLSLARTGTFPVMRTRLVQNAYRTFKYRMRQLSRRPYLSS